MIEEKYLLKSIFEDYIKSAYSDDYEMSLDQIAQLQGCFYYGCAKLLLLLRDDLTKLDQNKGIEILNNMTKEAKAVLIDLISDNHFQSKSN